MQPKINPELLLSITKELARRYGEDRAHDVVVKVLEAKQPIKSLKSWAVRCACGIGADEYRFNPHLINFSDLTKSEGDFVRSLGHEI